MISAAILVLSVGALAQFFFAYCRSLLATYGTVELSPKTKQTAGICDEVAAGQFRRLLVLVSVYPDPGDDAFEIRAISAYYSLVRFFRALFGFVAEPIRHWADRELASCAYFAAVSLDRRIAPARE
jgi:hypothetical protein